MKTIDKQRFFCKEFGEIVEIKGSCGKNCDSYKPMNGKSGICTYHGYIYDHGKDISINLNKKN
jgi:hypothetical protein